MVRKIDFRIQSLVGAAGDDVPLKSSGLVCVVGANNVGKSRLLRDIQSLAETNERPVVTLRAVSSTKSPTELPANSDGLLDGIAVRVRAHESTRETFTCVGGQPSEFDYTSLKYWWAGGWQGPAPQGLLVRLHTAGSLGSLAVGRVSFEREGRDLSLLGVAFEDGAVDAALSDLCSRVFGFPLTFDRATGKFQYRVGMTPIPAPPLDRPTTEYRDAIKDLELLEDQGDGVKSFLGLALEMMAGTARVLIVDEPESFLHPPQARALGQWLAEQATTGDKQVIVATHDKDFLLGAVESSVGVDVVRVDRGPDGKTQLRHLNASRVQDLWADPVMRYSNLLQGVFHRQVVIAESDADCRFYRAVLDEAADDDGKRVLAGETLFVPSGGKDRVASMISALSSVGTHARAIVDFDVFRTKATITAILTATGGAWSGSLTDNYKQLMDFANGGKLWDTLKKQGLGALRGAPLVATKALLEELKVNGILVVPVGEMEDFDRAIDREGGAWVSAMLSAGNHATNADAKRMVGSLLDG